MDLVMLRFATQIPIPLVLSIYVSLYIYFYILLDNNLTVTDSKWENLS